MANRDIFSKRKKRLEKGTPDVYQYEEIPSALRNQIVHIWLDLTGGIEASNIIHRSTPRADLWQKIHNALAREYGVFNLGGKRGDPLEQCVEFISGAEVEGVLDIVEVSFGIIDECWRSVSFYAKQKPDDAVRELNGRFREHGVGYEYLNGHVVRVDSQYLHREAVRPALGLLSDEGFGGALAEFESAHEHYRHGRPKEAIVDALKSFESVMKTIFKVRGWQFGQNDAAKKLIQVVFDNDLLPAYLTNHFSGLRSVLEGGVPTVRNKTSGHGQGDVPVDVPDYLAAYVLHATAANIVLLIEAHKSK